MNLGGIVLVLFFAFASQSSIAQTVEKTDSLLQIDFESCRKEVLASSCESKKTRYKMNLLVLVVPDNFVFLELNKNGSYKYLRGSGFSRKLGKIEAGNYEFRENKIYLIPRKKSSETFPRTFHLVISKDENAEHCAGVHCAKRRSKNYCLVLPLP